MTTPKAKIAASLAERGRPEMWANEQESAVLSGMAPDKFRDILERLEKAGFPKINHWNGLRFVPAVLEFWKREVDAGRYAMPESPPVNERDLENFDDRHGQRKSARN